MWREDRPAAAADLFLALDAGVHFDYIAASQITPRASPRLSNIAHSEKRTSGDIGPSLDCS
jgi:hypothetical protein